jgi:hypothetical protein
MTLAAVVLCSAAIGASLAIAFATEGHTETGSHLTHYPGVALSDESPQVVRRSASEPPTSIPSPSSGLTPEPETRTPLPPTPTPAVLAATATPRPPTSDAPAATPERRQCPAYTLLLDPSAGLVGATQGAIAMWERYFGCPVFEIAGGGITIRYEADWPGQCLDPDIAACTFNGIFLSPVSPLYDPQSVIAHELGHILNFGHAGGPGVMNPAGWTGPDTVWCELDLRCG